MNYKMKLCTLLIILIFIGSGEITHGSKKQTETNSSTIISDNLIKNQKSGNDDKRSENIKIIDTNLKNQQKIGSLKKDPLILINNTAFTFQEFESAKDTVAIIGKGDIKEISVAGGVLEKMVRDKYKKSGNSGVLMVTISEKQE
ncbi:hypothetical protein [Maribellus sediminis]|uniref:hypothetical protein n=1 Tax=Maribellus sediminis TaxID=2696285 RepID=UPI001430B670|nr:hypothetical protein [Maribellus sediminis]